jgi:hypothetical protein
MQCEFLHTELEQVFYDIIWISSVAFEFEKKQTISKTIDQSKQIKLGVLNIIKNYSTSFCAMWCVMEHWKAYGLLVINSSLNNILGIMWRSLLFVEEKMVFKTLKWLICSAELSIFFKCTSTSLFTGQITGGTFY